MFTSNVAKPSKSYEDNDFQGKSTKTKESAKMTTLKEEQEVMKITDSHESRNDKVQNFN